MKHTGQASLKTNLTSKQSRLVTPKLPKKHMANQPGGGQPPPALQRQTLTPQPFGNPYAGFRPTDALGVLLIAFIGALVVTSNIFGTHKSKTFRGSTARE